MKFPPFFTSPFFPSSSHRRRNYCPLFRPSLLFRNERGEEVFGPLPFPRRTSVERMDPSFFFCGCPLPQPHPPPPPPFPPLSRDFTEHDGSVEIDSNFFFPRPDLPFPPFNYCTSQEFKGWRSPLFFLFFFWPASPRPTTTISLFFFPVLPFRSLPSVESKSKR